MGFLTVTGANILCTFGTAPGTLNVTSQTTCLADGKPVATIVDTVPNGNLSPMGMCTSIANPQVAAATAAALGVLTPQPCICMAAGTWIPVKPTVLIGGKPCLSNESKLICTNGMGVVTIQSPGQTKVLV